LGQNIRMARKAHGWSQERLAEKADLHPVYVGEIERGVKNVSFDVLVRLSRALRCRVSELVQGIDA